MIIGFGNDLVDIHRIEAALMRFGERFEKRVFTENEREYSHGNPARYAKRFAAKEACAKALGTGMGQGIRWQDIEVTKDDHGAPHILLHHLAKPRLMTLTPPHHTPHILLALTDEHPYALAQVIIEARPVLASPL